MINDTKNQHFLSQAEQRQNSYNTTSKVKQQKIYSFDVIGNNNSITLSKHKSCKIESNLSEHDLFTYDIINSNKRRNLEDAFKKYENVITDYTESLRGKIFSGDTNISEELVVIFAAKLMNVIRNPYSIKNTLEVFGKFSDYYPTDKDLFENFARIDEGTTKSVDHLCSKYGVNRDEYRRWIKTLFILLASVDNQVNPLDLFVKTFFENEAYDVRIFVFSYNGVHEDKHVLLSDKGFTRLTDDSQYVTYEFNLDSNSFISYVFTNFDLMIENIFGPHSDEYFKRCISQYVKNERANEKNIRVRTLNNELNALSRYNYSCASQAYKRVFCKGKNVYGLKPSYQR